ncbi:MAG: hypothetical protein J6W08_02960 [Alphaproteobacteria bacterium]|nr:hypothetical protein [Alphaproteobacteria bacterium]
MKNIVKTVSLLTIISLIPAAFAATSRVGMINKTASSRLPSIAGYMVSGGTTTVRTATSSTTSYLGDQECLDKYTDCIKGTDACGANLEECTTRVLFHAQMPKCLNVLYQCSAAGVNQLFGTSSISALSNATYKTVGGAQEIDDYTYPAAGSALYIMIDGAAQANKLTKDQCVRRYTNCLKRDDICGNDFELCTEQKEFRKQAVLCDSTLSRCQNDAKTELFGSVANADSLSPNGNARLKTMIDDGAALAAKNAVLTCEKVVDNCLYNACVKNPWRCVAGTNTKVIDTADFVAGGIADLNVSANARVETSDTRTDAQVRQMFKAQCLSKIGSNKYCHMTHFAKIPSDKDLVDIDLQEEVFALAYSDRKNAVNTKIQEVLKKFDKDAKDKCVDTIKSCAMRSCGGGLGSVCYKLSGSAQNGTHINGNDETYNEVKSGCEAIVNADANCQYAAASSDTDSVYTYSYTDQTTFDTLFPKLSESTADPIGAIGTLNAILATSYNDAAIEQMKKQCQTVVLSCVKSMCGKDYENCYRARTDILSGSYDTGVSRFDKSMNKMGGVLDYNIVQGLCMNTVKNSTICEEHLKVATAETRREQDSASWGNGDGQYSSVRDAWKDANTTSSPNADVLVACAVSEANAQLNENCIKGSTMKPEDGAKACIGVMDEAGCLYTEPVYQMYSEFVLENGATSLFQTLLADVEKEAQAKYNAKLTKEQRVCLSNNSGGIMGSTDTGSTFMWVKIKSGKVPNSYVTNGLSAKQFVASNDLYGSFCRAKITLLSDDKDIQEVLTNYGVNTAYFAVGDSFTCGSWIKSSDLQKISDEVGERELCKQGYGKWVDGKCDGSKLSTKEKLTYAWATIAPALAGGAIGMGLTESGLISKVMTKGNEKNGVSQETIDKWSEKCESRAQEAANRADAAAKNTSDYSKFKSEVEYANAAAGTAYTACSKMGMSEKDGCKKLSIKYKTEDSGGSTVLKNATDAKTDAEAFKTNMEFLKSACADYVGEGGENGKAIKAARIAVPIATTLAGGALGAGITASVIKTKKENIKNEAAQKWMDEVGSHIQCYVGGEEVGTYGDVVTIELD